ncbi:TonB-dependent receptor [bacterium]|nr:TonB-dependent receptor [bacterium]
MKTQKPKHFRTYKLGRVFRLLSTIVVTLTVQLSYAQSCIVSGTVQSKSSGEALPAAMIKNLKYQGCFANHEGKYQLTLQAGIHTLTASYFGMKDSSIQVEIKGDTVINWLLNSAATEITGVVVKADKQIANVHDRPSSVVALDIAKIKAIPVIFGEVDVLKTITLMPGIQSGGEGSSGLHVRGGAQDHNQILLDGAPIYNAAHLMGFFSVFNGDAVKDIEVYKGGIPAAYGGRLASLINVTSTDGSMTKFKGSGGIGTISSRVAISGPIIKNKASFMLAGRRSYADVFTPLAKPEIIKKSKLYFYDLNFKAFYQVNSKNKIYLSAYNGRDVLGLGQMFGLDWGNSTASLRWNHIFNEKLYCNTTAVVSNFNYGFGFEFDKNTAMKFKQTINDISLTHQGMWLANESNKLTYGTKFILHRFNPGTFHLNDDEMQLEHKTALEPIVFVEHANKINSRINLRFGLRAVAFANIGGTSFYYSRDEDGDPNLGEIQKEQFDKYSISNLYRSVEPRIAMSVMLDSTLSLKLNYNKTSQFIQQASNTSSPFPTDQWFSANNNVKPQYAHQVALGLFKDHKYGFESSVEIYYKSMMNLIDYRDGANLFVNEHLDAELLHGKGKSFGAEFYLSKTVGKLNGFLSSTISRSLKQIDGINSSKEYSTSYDVLHNSSLVLNYKPSDKWSFGAAFVLTGGKPITIPEAKYQFEGRWNNHYGERNSYRLSNYHRLDLSVTYKPQKQSKRINGEWNLSIYNVYNRANTYAMYFPQASESQAERLGVKKGETIAVNVVLFKMIPSLTWNYKF